MRVCVNAGTVIVMGVIAGGTIFIGLPVGRLSARAAGLRAMLNAITIGVLLFLLWDVLVHAVEPVEAVAEAAAAAEEAVAKAAAAAAAEVDAGDVSD